VTKTFQRNIHAVCESVINNSSAKLLQSSVFLHTIFATDLIGEQNESVSFKNNNSGISISTQQLIIMDKMTIYEIVFIVIQNGTSPYITYYLSRSVRYHTRYVHACLRNYKEHNKSRERCISRRGRYCSASRRQACNHSNFCALLRFL
jgi:hypothetical protein